MDGIEIIKTILSGWCIWFVITAYMYLTDKIKNAPNFYNLPEPIRWVVILITSFIFSIISISLYKSISYLMG